MFCDNCGNQLDPSFRYCSQCGKDSQPQPDASICMTCGAPLIPGAKFCNNCGSVTAPASGAANKPSVSFCKYCSLEYHPQDKFCKQCGQPKDNGRSSGGSFLKAVSGNGLLYSPTDLHQIMLAALFFIIFLFWFVPSISFGISEEIGGLSGMGGVSISVALFGPSSNGILSMALSEADASSMSVVFSIIVVILDLIPLLGAVALSVLAIVKGQLNPKFLLIQRIIAIKAFCGIFVQWIIYAIALAATEIPYSSDSLLDYISVVPNFWGWVIIPLLCAGAALATFWLAAQTKHLQNQH